MRATEFITERMLRKNSWEVLVTADDKEDLGPQLVDLVKTAYSKTPMGSFVNSIKDVLPSDWQVIDWDNEPDVDATVFFRYNRPHENWAGIKIQGIGHDGARGSKDRAVHKLIEMLNDDGTWLESSDAMRHILHRQGLRPVTDERLLRKLFSDASLKMISRDTYTRRLENGVLITETVFGNPRLK